MTNDRSYQIKPLTNTPAEQVNHATANQVTTLTCAWSCSMAVNSGTAYWDFPCSSLPFPGQELQSKKSDKTISKHIFNFKVTMNRQQHHNFFLYCDVHPSETVFRSKKKNNKSRAGLGSICQLLMGLRDVAISKVEADERKLAGVGFKRTKWLEKFCTSLNRSFFSPQSPVMTFWLNTVHNKI